MASALAALNRFVEEWHAPIEAINALHFQMAELGETFDAPYLVADRFVQAFGMKSIGHNWEMLDCYGELGQPRAALTNIAQAVGADLTAPTKPIMADQDARTCAAQFLAAFDPATRTLVSNRYEGLWNPISGAEVEWGFVGYDERTIALLLLTPSS